MRPIDHINAFPPGITGGGDWYDEMLISGDRVIVIGYSYAHEARTLMLMGVVIAVLGLLAVLAGAGVLVMLETRLSAL